MEHKCNCGTCSTCYSRKWYRNMRKIPQKLCADCACPIEYKYKRCESCRDILKRTYNTAYVQNSRKIKASIQSKEEHK